MTYADTPTDWTEVIRVTGVWLRLCPAQPWRLPERPEVVIRGALGVPLYKHPTLGAWWRRGEGGSLPAPYRLASWTPGGTQVDADTPWLIELMLFGDVPDVDALLDAMTRMAAAGLGPDRVVHTLDRVDARGQGVGLAVIAKEARVGRWPEPAPVGELIAVPKGAAGVGVRLDSPWQRRGLKADRPPEPARLLQAAVDRAHSLAGVAGARLAERWPAFDSAGGEWLDRAWVGYRHPRRDKRPVDLSGWVGELWFGADAAPFFDVLAVAEVAGVGRSTDYGLGRIQLAWEVPSETLAEKHNTVVPGIISICGTPKDLEPG